MRQENYQLRMMISRIEILMDHAFPMSILTNLNVPPVLSRSTAVVANLRASLEIISELFIKSIS